MGGYCCDMRGMLSFLILFLLSKKPMCGSDIAKEIGKRKGEIPSPGTIYPALKGLKEAGLIKEKKEGKEIQQTASAASRAKREITYSITPDGKRGFAHAKRHFCRTFMDVF